MAIAAYAGEEGAVPKDEPFVVDRRQGIEGQTPRAFFEGFSQAPDRLHLDLQNPLADAGEILGEVGLYVKNIWGT